ncbi:MAG: rod shape-determining protein MreC [bacterium]
MKQIKKNKEIIIIICVILFFIFYFLNLFKPVANGLLRIFSPVQKGLYALSSQIENVYDASFNGFKNKINLANENIYLKEEVKNLKIENVNSDLLKNENKQLKDLLSFTDEGNYIYVASEVIGKSGDESNTLLIDKGLNDGIKIGLVAVNEKGLVIGKILKCTDVNSHILLLNDNQSRIAGAILNHTETNGVVEGEYGLSMTMNLIPQNIPVAKNNILITSGLEQGIPYGLVIGEVNEVKKTEGSLFQSANIQPLFPLDSAHIVAVILPK